MSGITFLDEEYLPDIREIQQGIEKALTSKNNIVRACYPKDCYDQAEVRLQVTVDLVKIRRDKNMRNTVKFTVDIIMADGTYSSDQEPDFAKIEISYIELQRYDPWDFMTYVVKPLIAQLQRWDELHGIKKEEPDLFVAYKDAKKTKAPPKKPPVPLKCEVKLESLDESITEEIIKEPVRAKFRALYVKATSNQQKCKLHVCSTLTEKEYDSLETGVEETGCIYVSLTKNGVIEKRKSTNTTVAYRIINEYLEKGTVTDMDAIEQEVLSTPPKTQSQQAQPNDASSLGCLVGAMAVFGFVFLFLVLPQLL